MTDEPVLLLDRAGAVATLTLNRPSTKNALSRELVRALGEALEEVTADASVRAVVLTGAGRSFCSGADLKSAMGEAQAGMDERIEEFHRLIRAIVRAPQPFVAAVDGPAVGFGADLALACDLRILADTGYIQEKFVKIGLMPDGGGTFWVPRLVGLGRAMEFLLLGTKIDANLALEVGLANRVVAHDALADSAASLATELAGGPPLAFAAIKRSVRDSFNGNVEAALDREKAEQLKLLGSKDMMEGVMAWAQHRPPKFTGE